MADAKTFAPELSALAAILEALQPLKGEQRAFVLRTATDRLGITTSPTESGANRPNPPPSGTGGQPGVQTASVPIASGMGVNGLSAKQFLLAKKPDSDTERVACLAYYLTHGKNTPHFKTADISAANTEAAQPKFSNASFAVSNATKHSRFLAAAGKGGLKQITALGEEVVMALPDRTAVKAALENGRSRRRPSRTAKKAQRASSSRKPGG